MTYHQITQEERYAITAQLMCGRSQTQIAQLLGRDRSTISRELRRNRTHHDDKYRAEKAHSYAVARRRRCRRRPRFSVEDMALVARLLRKKWSAEQISGVLRKHGTLPISHETIYRRIRWDKRSGRDLWRHTRIMSKFGRKRYRSVDSRGVLPGKRPIGERPADKATSGPTQPSRESATPPASSNGTTIVRSLDHATNSAASSSAALSLVAGPQYA